MGSEGAERNGLFIEYRTTVVAKQSSDFIKHHEVSASRFGKMLAKVDSIPIVLLHCGREITDPEWSDYLLAGGSLKPVPFRPRSAPSFSRAAAIISRISRWKSC